MVFRGIGRNSKDFCGLGTVFCGFGAYIETYQAYTNPYLKGKGSKMVGIWDRDPSETNVYSILDPFV